MYKLLESSHSTTLKRVTRYVEVKEIERYEYKPSLHILALPY